MLNDFLARKHIASQGREIAEGIKERYSLEIDSLAETSESKTKKKARRKLENAISFGLSEVRTVSQRQKLGVYGKAKLCKAIQDELLSSGYSAEAARLMVESFAKIN